MTATLIQRPAPKNSKAVSTIYLAYEAEPRAPVADVYLAADCGRRLVACWNACKDIDTARLEAHAQGAPTDVKQLQATVLALQAAVRMLIDETETPSRQTSAARTLMYAYARRVLHGDIRRKDAPSLYPEADSEPITPADVRAPVSLLAPAPVGPFYVMVDYEQSAAECPTLEAARIEGRKLADAEPIPCTFSIQDANGQHIEDITRTDGRTLPELMAAFDAEHRK